MSNIVIPDGGTIGSASDTDAISIPANGKPTFSAGIASTGTIDAGIIADTVTQPSTYYINGKIGANHDIALSAGEMLNLNGNTNPYMTWSGSVNSFGNGSGNVSASDDTSGTVHDFKFTKKGIYYVNFTLQGRMNTTSGEHRFLMAQIRGNGSTPESTTVIQENYGQLINQDNSYHEFNQVTSTTVKEFNANDYINFYVDSDNNNHFNIRVETSISIFLIRAVA
jgi:hypothetical protein